MRGRPGRCLTLGNREASGFVPLPGVDELILADAAQLSSLADETPEGRSVVVLAKDRYGLRAPAEGELNHAQFVEFSAQTRMSGIDLRWDNGAACFIRKGAAAQMISWVELRGGTVPTQAGMWADSIAASGGSPLLVAVHDRDGPRMLGIIHLKDVVKDGIRERFAELRRMGIRTAIPGCGACWTRAPGPPWAGEHCCAGDRSAAAVAEDRRGDGPVGAGPRSAALGMNPRADVRARCP